MTVTLPPALVQFVEQRVRAGFYLSESEVVADALRMLIESDHRRGGDLAGRLTVSLGPPFTLSNPLGQLGKLEIEIKELMHQVARLKKQESDNMEQIEKAQEALGAITSNLQATLDAYRNVREAIQQLDR